MAISYRKSLPVSPLRPRSPPPLPVRSGIALPFYFRVRWASTGSTPSPARQTPARAASEQGSRGGGGGLSIASYFRSAEEGSICPKRKKEKNGRKVYYFGLLRRRQQFRQEVLLRRRRRRHGLFGVGRSDLASGSGSSRSSPDGCQLFRKRSLLRKLSAASEGGTEGPRLCKANSVRSNFVQTLRISPSLSL